MSKGQKMCPECGNGCGPRCYSCPQPDCDHEFKFKNEGDVLDWKELKAGDVFKVKNGSGPFWLSKDSGERIPMGYSGEFEFKCRQGDCIIALSLGGLEVEVVAIYMGPECISKIGMHRRPHRIVSLKKPKQK